MTVTVHHGDSREVLAAMPADSVDAIVTDPPYEIAFMSRSWDASGVAYDPSLWAEALRVLKPGGHLLAFGGSRTYHRMTVAIEDAGFEVRDSIHWIYGSGFPKSLDVSKAIDKAAGAERPREKPQRRATASTSIAESGFGADGWAPQVKAAATPEAAAWSGWGTALKPSHEPIVVARKPLAGTVAANVLEYGTGGLNIDGCRVAAADGPVSIEFTRTEAGRNRIYHDTLSQPGPVTYQRPEGGRWPANVVLTHAAECQPAGVADVKASGNYPAQRGEGQATGFGKGQPDPNGPRPSGNGDGTETVAVWRCAPGCPVAELDRQSGRAGALAPASGPTRRDGHRSRAMAGALGGLGDQPAAYHADSGGASRFYTTTEWDPLADQPPFRYVAKPAKRERNAGLEFDNRHPTVKPVGLLRWLVRLVTPPGGVVLDPFAGSGTTLVAAVLEGFDTVGVELTEDYLPIIAGRVAWAETEARKAAATPTLFDTPNP